MVVGSPPFYSKNRQLTFRLILSAEINFPEGMDANCVHLIRSLLTREPKKRLGRQVFPLALALLLHYPKPLPACLSMLQSPIPYRPPAAAAMAPLTSGHTLFSRASTGPP